MILSVQEDVKPIAVDIVERLVALAQQLECFKAIISCERSARLDVSSTASTNARCDAQEIPNMGSRSKKSQRSVNDARLKLSIALVCHAHIVSIDYCCAVELVSHDEMNRNSH